jgi:hypothetical protein
MPNSQLIDSKTNENSDIDKHNSAKNIHRKTNNISNQASSSRPNAYSYTTYSNQPKSNLSLFDKQYERILSLLNTNSMNNGETSRNMSTISSASANLNSSAKPLETIHKVLAFEYKHPQPPQSEHDSCSSYSRSKSV